jgi:hypothetical protein
MLKGLPVLVAAILFCMIKKMTHILLVIALAAALIGCGGGDDDCEHPETLNGNGECVEPVML